MRNGKHMERSFKTMPALCLALALPVLGCTQEKMTGPTPQQTVMDAQRTAKTETTSMDGAEADEIYKNYIKNIGKPVRPTSALSD
ncbi:MAG: hypothetical protein K8R18_11965 [Parvibaculum sp.]|uniref:hypothetical protein n=1 Tax=Parvibaculum sp. TaxID=2024848 RepID=UPI0025CDBB3B|nr:hypothetical protein [Parvibaculum sp.]MCE9650328.1 hypothetical protein [Parvibaculum sp.]